MAFICSFLLVKNVVKRMTNDCGGNMEELRKTIGHRNASNHLRFP
jgi:hypothetical protein